MKTGTRLFFKGLVPIALVIFVSAGEPVKSTVYEWNKLKMVSNHRGSESEIMKGATRSLEMFHIRTVMLRSGKETHRYLIEKGCDNMIIIKEGTAEITINSETRELGTGSVAVASQGDRVLIRNITTGSMTFYSFLFKPHPHPVTQSGTGTRIPPLFKEWNSIEFKPSSSGGRRDIMRQPTSSLRELEIHTTTLKEGLPSHNSHTHPDEEIILIRFGTVEESINGKSFAAGTGSVIFLTNDDDHGIRNAGTGQCEYYAIRWLVYDDSEKK